MVPPSWHGPGPAKRRILVLYLPAGLFSPCSTDHCYIMVNVALFKRLLKNSFNNQLHTFRFIFLA